VKYLPNLFNNKNFLVGQANHTNKMNRSILKQLNKDLSKNSYVRRINKGEIFFGVSLKTLLNPSEIKLTGRDQVVGMGINEDGELVNESLSSKSLKHVDDNENFGVTSSIKPNVKQSDDYTFLIKVEEVELVKGDEDYRPAIRVKCNCLVPFWIDGSNEVFQNIQSQSAETVIDTVLGILTNMDNIEFSGVHYEGCGQYINVTDRNELVNQLPKSV
jgi:hypothetical protein